VKNQYDYALFQKTLAQEIRMKYDSGGKNKYKSNNSGAKKVKSKERKEMEKKIKLQDKSIANRSK
jgi:hypothetical protein